MLNQNEPTAAQRAEQKRAAKRIGQPTFTTVRFTDSTDRSAEGKKAFITSVIEAHGGTREAALLAAFEALERNLEQST